MGVVDPAAREGHGSDNILTSDEGTLASESLDDIVAGKRQDVVLVLWHVHYPMGEGLRGP